MQEPWSEVTGWLLNHVDHTVVIRKEEDGDTDRVKMKLHQVTYRPEISDGNDYIDAASLVLHGDGVIATENGTGAAELPLGKYEIPLGRTSQGSTKDGALLIHTERATYQVISI